MKAFAGSLVLLLATAAVAASPKLAPMEPAGVAQRVFDPSETRNWRGAAKHELDCTIWYPAADGAVETEQAIGPPGAPLFLEGKAAQGAEFAAGGGKRPLVLLSHGTGGSAAQMAWLGIALAHAGMIAVAVNHPGNNALAPYTPEGFVLWWERATDLSDVLDGMLADTEFGPRIDRRMIGAAGFSLGGYTVLELAGAQTDVSAIFDVCRATPNAPVCSPPEMKGMPKGEALMAAVRKTSGESLARSSDSFRDDRIRSVFAIAPALGAVLTVDGLREVRVPVAIVVGAADPIAPGAENAEKIRAGIRGAKLAVLPGGIAHYTFLDTCTATGKAQLPEYCVDNAGVDRAAVHAQVSGMAVEFFDQTLKWK
jgi:predicted dienelactone hydrolase